MNTYTRLGITITPKDEIAPYNAPKWALDTDEGSSGVNCKGCLVDSGEFYLMPLSSIDAVQLASDCADYANEADAPLSIDEENELAELLQKDDDSELWGKFGE